MGQGVQALLLPTSQDNCFVIETRHNGYILFILGFLLLPLNCTNNTNKTKGSFGL
jgi:hypothetical protein